MERDTALVNQPTKAPTRKVAASGLWGALVVVALLLLHAAGVEVPGVDPAELPAGEVLTLLVTVAAGYISRDTK